MKETHVLVLGQRKGLNKALKELEIPFTVIKDVKAAPLEQLIKELGVGESVTHVLASGEGTVLLANQARQLLGLPLISPQVLTLCSDKLEMKKKASEMGVAVTPFLPGETSLSSEEVYNKLGPKVVVKDRNNSGGKGQKVFRSPEPIVSSEDQLIEAFVNGKEMSIESFIQKGELKFVSTTRYKEIGVINIVPSLLQGDLLESVFEVNKRVISAFGIEDGLTHLEVYLTEQGVLFGEVALRPPGGHIMTLLDEAHGIKSWQLYVMINLGIELPQLRSIGKHAGAIVYHPGVGEVVEIRGKSLLEDLETLSSYKIKSEVGDQVGPRDGVGKERANFIFSSENRQKLDEDIDNLRTNFLMVLK